MYNHKGFKNSITAKIHSYLLFLVNKYLRPFPFPFHILMFEIENYNFLIKRKDVEFT